MPDDAPHRGLPTLAESIDEMNRFRAPVMPVRPKFDLASAHQLLSARLNERDVALGAFSRQVEVCTNAEAASTVAALAVGAFSGLDDEIAALYAQQIEAGESPVLTPALKQRTRDHHEAATHLAAVRAAESRI